MNTEEQYSKLEIENISFHDKGMKIDWSCPEVGFGELHVYKMDNGDIGIDTEQMDVPFVQQLFKTLIDKAII